MAKIEISYAGDLKTLCKNDHGATLLTDAPKEFQGEGEAFSPTDLLTLSLGSCILTVMAIAAKRQGIDLKGATASVEKEMATSGLRRIAKITVVLHIPGAFTREMKEKLEKVAATCPVKESLHPDIEQLIKFSWEK